MGPQARQPNLSREGSPHQPTAEIREEQQSAQSPTLPRRKHRQKALHKGSALAGPSRLASEQRRVPVTGASVQMMPARARKQALPWVLYPIHVSKGREVAGHSWAWIRK